MEEAPLSFLTHPSYPDRELHVAAPFQTRPPADVPAHRAFFARDQVSRLVGPT